MKPEDPTPRSAVTEGKLKRKYIHLDKIYEIDELKKSIVLHIIETLRCPFIY